MKNLIRSILTLVLSISVGFGTFAQDAPKKKVAVYMTGDKVDETYKKVIGSKLVTAITESGEYAAVERTSDFLAAISAENDYQTSGEVRNNQIAALGQKFGVKYVVVADVSEVFDEFFIAARTINVETGLVERACDVNGTAESMAQLIDLSKNIATGLLAGISPSTSSQHAPIHLSLCAVDNQNGQVQYFTAEQWQKMSAVIKLNYIKQGVVIAETGEAFLVAMNDTGVGPWDWANQCCNLPTTRQLTMILKYIEPLNAALQIFGGKPFGLVCYWSNEICDSNLAWSASMKNLSVEKSFHSHHYTARDVVPLSLSISK